ncbi:hypothetical protein ACRQDV_08765 [Actinotignum sp. GS-2025e]|uniref:hypothetical protein n=1 Tax=Actinotignum sp. GS-2025e TaxID=3427278 RepID=UPI003F465908
MHVMTKYLDTRKAAIAALQDYPFMEQAADDASHVAGELRADLVNLPSPQFDGTPRHTNPHAGENRIVATLDKIDLLAERRRQARQYLDWFLPAWGLLSEDDRFVLEAFFLGEGSQENAVNLVCDHFYVERTTAHQKKSRALRRLATALYGPSGL